MIIIAALLLVAVAEPAAAREVGGAEVGWTRLADLAVDEASALGLVIPVAVVVLAGLVLLLNYNLGVIASVCISCSILVLGSAAFSGLFGAELSPGMMP